MVVGRQISEYIVVARVLSWSGVSSPCTGRVYSTLILVYRHRALCVAPTCGGGSGAGGTTCRRIVSLTSLRSWGTHWNVLERDLKEQHSCNPMMPNTFIGRWIIDPEWLRIYPIEGMAANSPVLQSARPRAVDSGEAKMRTASWENVDKQMPRKIRNNTWACFKWPKNVDKTTSHWNTQYNNDLHSL